MCFDAPSDCPLTTGAFSLSRLFQTLSRLSLRGAVHFLRSAYPYSLRSVRADLVRRATLPLRHVTQPKIS
jgi:hypothetical protein